MSGRIVRGDALALPLADESVDLIVTSPPYFGLRSYQDGGQHYAGQLGAEATPREFVDALIAATAEMVRVLKPTGSLWVNLGDRYAANSDGYQRGARPGVRQPAVRVPTGARPKSLLGIPWRYAIRAVDDLGLILRAEVIWAKPNGLPESVTDRVRRSHETWFHLTREPRYFAATDKIRTPHARSWGGGPNGGGAYAVLPAPGEKDSNLPAASPHALGALPGSVWTVPTQPLKVPDRLGVDHFAAFPMEWPRRIIRGWCPEGGTVLDPFGGTGTTALVAHALGRHGISVDLSADYCRLATWRTTDPGQLAAAMQVDKPDAAPVGMDSLLDLISTGAAS